MLAAIAQKKNHFDFAQSDQCLRYLGLHSTISYYLWTKSKVSRTSYAAMWENVPTDMPAQRRLKSACPFSQSDQSSMPSWSNLASLAIQNAPSEDSDQTAHARSDLNLHWVHVWRYISDVVAQSFIYFFCFAILPGTVLSTCLFFLTRFVWVH